MEKIDIVKLANERYVVRRVKSFLKIFKNTKYLYEVYRCVSGHDMYYHEWHSIEDVDSGFGGAGSYYESYRTQHYRLEDAQKALARHKKAEQGEREDEERRKEAHIKSRTVVEVIKE